MPTNEIKDVRRRLAALSTDDVEAASRTPATSLADCRVLQSRLRELKREVLGRISALRTEVSEQSRELARARAKSGPWKERKEGAKSLLAGVQKQVIQLIDGKHGDAFEAWSQVSEEIDARLAKLEALETQLARRAGEDDGIYRQGPPPLPNDAGSRGSVPKATGDDLYTAAGAASSPPRTEAKAEEPLSDDVYAAVGATAQKGEKADAYCPHCGKGHDADDRFCRRCGHRLDKD